MRVKFIIYAVNVFKYIDEIISTIHFSEPVKSSENLTIITTNFYVITIEVVGKVTSLNIEIFRLFFFFVIRAESTHPV
ncbi:hypothetical protein EF849_09045 [Aeromonas jandaei]|nr:hypothetical protein [Aeromonas jandaei]